MTESDIASAPELCAPREKLNRLTNHRIIRPYNFFFRLILFNLMRGMALSRMVLGALRLLSLLAWSVSQIEFLPIMGKWPSGISRQMQDAR